MNKLKLILLVILSVASFSFIDLVDDIALAINSGNSKNVSQYFIENVDLKVLEQEDVYSKQQAEMILKSFFTKHPVTSFKVVHKSTPKNGSQYIIGTLETSNGIFRITFLNKITGSKTLIQQFRIETENE